MASSLDGLPSVSVILVGRDDHQRLGLCLNALLSQNYHGDVEILFAAGDAAADAIAAVSADVPDVTVTTPSPDSAAADSPPGPKWARGEVLAFLDPAAELAPDWLAALVRPLVGGPATALVEPALVIADDRGSVASFDSKMARRWLTGRVTAHNGTRSTWSARAFALRADRVRRLGRREEPFLRTLEDADNLANLEEVLDDPRHAFVRGDIADKALVDELVGECDAVVNFAAETHVDRSLIDSAAFVGANVTGVLTLLDAARRHGRRLVHVSTDEVYGDVEAGRSSVETDPLRPRSPYAAAKAGGELMARAYFVSYGTDVLITRGCNTIGPRQYPEKMVPLFVTNALQDKQLPVYGDGLQVRDWLHVEDHAAAIDLVLRRGAPGEVYNIGAGNEQPNLEVVRALLARLGKPETLITNVPDRPGHDRRYALDWGKIRRELGWSPHKGFAQTLNDTVDWYVAHRAWWEAIRGGGDFMTYFEQQYGWRLAAAGAGGRT